MAALTRRPLLWAAAGAVWGIIAADALWPSRAQVIAFCLAALVLLAAGVAIPAVRRRRWAVLLLCALLAAGVFAFRFVSGFADGRSFEPAVTSPGAQPKSRIVGTIAETPSIVYSTRRMGSFARTRTLLHVREVNGKPADASMLVYFNNVQPDLAYGDVVSVDGVIRLPAGPGNPGESDYATYLRNNGISGSVTVSKAKCWRIIERASGSPLTRAVLAYKGRCQNAVNEAMPPSQATILNCLLMGRTSELEASQQIAFRETGTLHLLAISGTHIVMVAGFVWLLMLLMGAGVRVSAVAVITVVSGYALLAGLGPSVQRAAIACIVVCGAYLFRRKPNLPSSLALALLVVLALRPADLFNQGMQLSFVAVAGIFLFTSKIEHALFGRPDDLYLIQDPAERNSALHWLRWTVQRSLSMSLAASLATAPLMAYHFNVFTPLAPVATLLLTPAVTLAMAAGLPAALLGPFIGVGAWPLFKLAAFGVWLMDWLARAMAQLPVVAQYGPSPGLWLTVFSYAVLACLAFLPGLLWRPWRAAGVLLVPVALYFGLVWHRPPPECVELRMLSLGGANCEVLRFPDGKTLLFDAGGWNMTTGARVLAPALWDAGVRRIDLAVLSHSDEDHCTGYEELARRIPVGRLALPAHFEKSRWVKGWVGRLARTNRIVRIARGYRIEGFAQAEIDVLWPSQDEFFGRVKNTNPLSAVLDVRTDGGRILLTGDLNAAGALALCGLEPDMRARVVQVPHHGHLDESSETLARAASAELALIPGGSTMPAQPTPWLTHSGRVLMTDECGMIVVKMREDELEVRTFLTGLEERREEAWNIYGASDEQAEHLE